MKPLVLFAALLVAPMYAQMPVSTPKSFEVATVKPVDPGPQSGRMLKMDTDNRFSATNFTLKLLIAAAYDLNPRTISGGPGWVESQKFEIHATTPGAKRHDAQMLMLQTLLTERFGLKFHRTPKDFLIYQIEVAKDGPKLKPTATPDIDPKVVTTVYPDKLVMPARNATVSDLARVMQRAILDRPVVDKSGLTARYDFDLEWAPDETQFGGEIPPMTDTQSPPLMVAMRTELGLELKATKGPIETLVIDAAHQPVEN